MNNKYELLGNDTKELAGRKLFRIRALAAIGTLVSAGDLGGYIEKESNLSVSDDAWVYGNAQVSDDARVSDDAWVSGNARVYGNAQVSDDARVSDDAQVSGNARVYGNAQVSDDAQVSGNAWVSGNARVYGNAQVSDDARVSDDAQVSGNARVSGNAQVSLFHHCTNITNQKFNLTFTPQNVAGGCRLFSHEEFKNLTLDQCESSWEEWELENYKGYQALFLMRMEKLE